MNWSKTAAAQTQGETAAVQTQGETAAVQAQGEFRKKLPRARELRNALLRARGVEEALGASTKDFLQSEMIPADGKREQVASTAALPTMRDQEPPTWGRWPLPLAARALQDLAGDSESMIHLRRACIVSFASCASSIW